jgi:hypothetical protein
MKKIKLLTILVLVPIILAFIYEEKNSGGKAETKSAPGNTVAFVKKIIKDVTYRKTSAQSDWDLAKTGTTLEDGGEVKTGDKSLALVYFIDGSGLLRVRENSILHVYGNKKDKAMDKNTYIQKGLIGFEVNKQSPQEEFKFTTPTVVASIRGTEGFIQYSEDSTFTMYLDKGSAGLYGSQNCDSLSAGSTIVVSSKGQCIYRNQDPNDKNKFNETNKTVIKKIKIKTNKGEVNIEYYGPGK